MKYETYIVICTTIVILAARWIVDQNPDDTLDFELCIKIEKIPEGTRTGGVEVAIAEPELAIRYVFPIHPEDFQDLSSPYGIRRSPFTADLKNHTGLDAFGVWHARILSVWHGVVIDHYPPPDGYYRGDGEHGARIIVQHDDGSIASYSHMSETYVHEGMRVAAGQPIGRQGDTGKADGEHLHFELTIEGELVNPLAYIEVPNETSESTDV